MRYARVINKKQLSTVQSFSYDTGALETLLNFDCRITRPKHHALHNNIGGIAFVYLWTWLVSPIT